MIPALLFAVLGWIVAGPAVGAVLGAGLLAAFVVRGRVGADLTLGIGMVGWGLASFARGTSPSGTLSLLALMAAHAVWRERPHWVGVIGALGLVVAAPVSGIGFALAWGVWLLTLTGLTRLFPIVAGSAVLIFLAIPRTTVAPIRPVASLTGFSADVELGDLAELLDDPAPVFVARFDRPLTHAPYFRGVALDHFDGSRWWSVGERRREPGYDGALPDAVVVTIQLEPLADGVLPVPGTVDGLDAGGLAVERDTTGSYRLPGPARSVGYRAWVRPPFGPGRTDPFLDAPPRNDVPPDLSEASLLAFRKAAGAGSPREQMGRLADWLRTGFEYSRTSGGAVGLERFLHTARSGHCEIFATALAIGGRTGGIPTRIVNGFVGGEEQPDGSLVFRGYHAHSWVEYFDGGHWVTIDPTPGAGAPAAPGLMHRATAPLLASWDELLALDPGSRWSRWAVAGAGALLVGAWLRRRPRDRPDVDPVTRELRRAASAWDLPTDLPDVEAARTVPDPEAARALEELAWASYEVRFGGRPAAPRVTRARELARFVIGRA